MKGVLDKISSYQILTNLLPGAFFGLGIKFFLGLELPTKSIGEDAVIYYFMGLIISRVGSLAVEPVLKRIGILNFADYQDFVNASEKNGKIEILSETNNYYRSLFTCSILFPVVDWLRVFASSNPWFFDNWKYLLLILVILLFLLSYKKQTDYVRKRVIVTLSK